YLTSGAYLQPGDILLYVNHHVAMNITKGKNAGSITVTPSTTPTTTPTNTTSYAGKGIGTAVALANMNIRAGASTTYKTYTTLKKGTTVEVLEILSNGWYKIVYSGASVGYAYTCNTNNKYWKYTAKVTKQPASATNPKYGATEVPVSFDVNKAGTYTITAASAANIRKGPGTSFGILYAAGAGKQLTCDGSYTTHKDGTVWLYVILTVKTTKIEGFISSKLTKKV
ncbi:MAG: SH3 domain-containing protein, partial [Bacilli bacterium]|nr:SH3 domain-containing protein [Bacilli bacterium]